MHIHFVPYDTMLAQYMLLLCVCYMPVLCKNGLNGDYKNQYCMIAKGL